MDFENEIFVSYAHADNKKVLSDDDPWVNQFHDALQAALSQFRRKEVRIWRDKKLEGNDVFDDTLIDRLGGVALLVSIFSPPYLQSDWCIREFEEYMTAAERSGGAFLEGKSRIFKIVKKPTDIEKQPAAARRLLGYEFFTVNPETGRSLELNPDLSKELKLAYRTVLNDVAHDICNMLEILEGSRSVSPAARTIYLAETTSDLKEARTELARSLNMLGHTVVPRERLVLMTAAELESHVREALASSSLSIHPVGGNFGASPEGSTESIVGLQNRIAAEHASSEKFGRMVWIPKNLDVGSLEDERQQKLIETMRSDPGLAQGADLMECSIEELKTAIQERIAELDGAKGTIYLAEVTSVLRQERKTAREALERAGYTVIPESELPLVAADLEQFVRESLEGCRASLHLLGRDYGIVPEQTRRSILDLQLELAGERGSGAGFQRFVWIQPDSETDDDRQQGLLAALRESGTDVLEGPLEAACVKVAEQLSSAPGPAEAEEQRSGPSRVYLIFDRQDVKTIMPLLKHLQSRFEVLLPSEGDTAREYHAEKLQTCDALLIYYGAAGEKWRDEMVNQVRKATAGRAAPLRAQAVYIAPPMDMQKELYDHPEFDVVREEEEFKPAALADFVAGLGSSAKDGEG